MALKFYLDTHVAKAVAEQLRISGLDVIRCEEVGMSDASDEDHLAYATREQRIILSQDEDFTILDARWRQGGRYHGGIMKVPAELQGEAQISFLVRELRFYDDAARAGAVDYSSEIANRVIYL